MRFALYARLSRSDDDRTLSLNNQYQACRRYAETHGTVTLEAQDVQSGLDPDRPGYQSILSAAREGRIDAAVVWRFDRWGRDTLEALRSFQELSALDVTVQSVSEPSDDPFLRDFLFLLANRESRVISARVKPVQKMNAKSGRWQGRSPVGYDLVDGHLEPNVKAPLVRELFKRAATGTHSVTDLRRWVHSVGLTSSTGRLPSRSLVHTWLTNPAYAGDVVYNRRANGRFEPKRSRPESEWVIAKDAHPAIVNRDIFTGVQSILAQHKAFPADVRGTNWLLTGLARCGHCGGRMYGRRAGSRGNYTYGCQRGLEYETCVLRRTGGKAVDRWVKAQVEGAMEISADVRTRAAEIVQSETERLLGEFSRRREQLLTAQRRHEESRRQLARKVLADTIPGDVYRQLEEEEATALHSIEAELSTLEKPVIPDLAPIMEMLSALTWDSLDDQGWREAVSLLVERVDVLGLNNYRLRWTETAEALRRVLQTVL